MPAVLDVVDLWLGNSRSTNCCLHMTLIGEADRHHLLDAVLEKELRANVSLQGEHSATKMMT